METGIDGLFQFNDDVLQGCGGLLKVRELLSEKLVTLFRLLEFSDDLVAAPDAGFLYLYLETLDIAPTLFLHAAFFRKCARRYLCPLPRVNGRANKGDPLTHLFLESASRFGNVLACGANT